MLCGRRMTPSGDPGGETIILRVREVCSIVDVFRIVTLRRGLFGVIEVMDCEA